jgi:signal peptidase I
VFESGKVKEWRIAVRSYPKSKLLDWNIGEFGPFYIPAKGSMIKMTPLTKVLYRNVIEWEQDKKLMVREDTVLLGDSIIYQYQFRENFILFRVIK